MTRMTDERIPRRLLLAAAAAGAVGTLPAPSAAGAAVIPAADSGRDPVPALRRAAHPLRTTEPGADPADLRPLGSLIGDAKVVGLGEATHGSHEFFAMKDRVFRHLVEEKGFTTFALEMSWPAGLRIDTYVQGGPGTARQAVGEALAGSPWEREEFVRLVQWMRDHNRRRPGHKVHFMGDDIGYPRVGDDLFERVTGYVQRHRPELLPRFTELYTGLRPLDDSAAYLRKPLADRQRLASAAQQAMNLLGRHHGTYGGELGWAVQHARSIAQTAGFLSHDITDPAVIPAAMRFRDRVMAENVAWWQRHTGHRMLVSAHNGHVAYVPDTPLTHPVSQGGVLRDMLGEEYLAVGFTFTQGSFLSQEKSEGPWKRFTVGAAGPGTNEHTLDRVRHDDYFLDLRDAPPAARAWLNTSRPTRTIGTEYPVPLTDIRLTHSYGALIHLHRIRAADKLCEPDVHDDTP
ncbi:erythromycin esterase family protein [Streptomyces sp. AV19]|uniref:erythromycin esterase family protein n=1 Tax=Streptomyces sp. AV19 TaxID=2793068 RepID=UPI0018FE7012|nr:erythromycin esterase family protein [Streptomyces sp. AV19]MBH1936018.1 erythromycin esterase family protein [Streptomyces sp. AV19]MDG4534190.1 erythromycin esterase family protein [Streptomyces sp. AV19]